MRAVECFFSCLRYFISKLFKNAKTKHFINLQLYSQSRNGKQLSIQCREVVTPGEGQLPTALAKYSDCSLCPAECLEYKVQLCTSSDSS